MPATQRPLHRSVRAELPQTAPRLHCHGGSSGVAFDLSLQPRHPEDPQLTPRGMDCAAQ